MESGGGPGDAQQGAEEYSGSSPTHAHARVQPTARALVCAPRWRKQEGAPTASQEGCKGPRCHMKATIHSKSRRQKKKKNGKNARANGGRGAPSPDGKYTHTVFTHHATAVSMRRVRVLRCATQGGGRRGARQPKNNNTKLNAQGLPPRAHAHAHTGVPQGCKGTTRLTPASPKRGSREGRPGRQVQGHLLGRHTSQNIRAGGK